MVVQAIKAVGFRQLGYLRPASYRYHIAYHHQDAYPKLPAGISGRGSKERNRTKRPPRGFVGEDDEDIFPIFK
jgi:hypothetical protein